jgi:feruloyl-CoA synthase
VGDGRPPAPAAGGLLSDVVVAGHDRDYVGVLAWVRPDAGLHSLVVRLRLARALRHHNENGGSSSRVMRLLVLSDPPDLDGGEITDKGYINQRAVLDRRAADNARLFAEPLDPDVIIPEV